MLEALALGGHDIALFRERTGGDHRRPGALPGRILPNAFFLGRALPQWLDELRELPDLLLCYGVDPRYLVRVQRWCRQHNVRLVVDIVDWYAADDVTGFGPKLFCMINDWWVMRSLVKRCDGAIVVSHLLERHCAALEIPTLRIPAAIGGLPAPPPRGGRGLTMTYAGAPGRREARALENLRRLAREGELTRLGLELQIVGLSAPTGWEPMADHGLSYLGRLPREKTLRRIAESRFTILQRPPDRRFAQAGFPSKVAESMLLGTPVVANLTSDLGEFLVDRSNSIVLSGDDYDSLRDGVARAVAWAASIDHDRIARQAAAQFSPRAIEPALTSFLDSLTKVRLP
jgi:hypothetical protein